MKELSIEEKVKRYDEAIERAKRMFSKKELNYLFPELKEGNKDSQIICPTFTFDDILALQCCMETVKKVQEDKELYEQLQSLHNRIYDAYWFEKQGNKSKGKSAQEVINEEKVGYVNKVEPKDYTSIDPHFGKPIDKQKQTFHEGDGISNNKKDEPKKDNRTVTERIKTFDDACNVLGDEHPFVIQYRLNAAAYKGDPMTEDFIAYLKLRIIAAALNEWREPKFKKGEYRYYPWFFLYTKEQYEELDDEEKGHCVLRSGNFSYSFVGFVYSFANVDASCSYASVGSRLAFRTRELAEYAGRQFAEEWADFVFKSE